MKTVIWIIFYLLTFAGLIGGMYIGKSKIVEKTKDMPVLNYTKLHDIEATTDSTYGASIDSLAIVIEGMLDQLSGYIVQMHKRDSTIASQQMKISKASRENEILQKELDALQEVMDKQADQEKQIQDLAKTLGGMKGDVLAPILKNLPDDVVRILYDKAKPKDRSKLLNSLTADRAGRIMRKIAGD